MHRPLSYRQVGRGTLASAPPALSPALARHGPSGYTHSASWTCQCIAFAAGFVVANPWAQLHLCFPPYGCPPRPLTWDELEPLLAEAYPDLHASFRAGRRPWNRKPEEQQEQEEQQEEGAVQDQGGELEEQQLQQGQEQGGKSPQGLQAHRGPAAAAVEAAAAAAVAGRNACGSSSTVPFPRVNQPGKQRQSGTAPGKDEAAGAWQAASGGKGGKGQAKGGGKAWSDLVAEDWLKGSPEVDWRRGRLAGAGFPPPGAQQAAVAAGKGPTSTAGGPAGQGE